MELDRKELGRRIAKRRKEKRYGIINWRVI